MTNRMRVTLEIGPKGKKMVAVAPDWPGLARGAKTEEAAIERLLSYVPRYAPVAKLAGWRPRLRPSPPSTARPGVRRPPRWRAAQRCTASDRLLGASSWCLRAARGARRRPPSRRPPIAWPRPARRCARGGRGAGTATFRARGRRTARGPPGRPRSAAQRRDRSSAGGVRRAGPSSLRPGARRPGPPRRRTRRRRAAAGRCRCRRRAPRPRARASAGTGGQGR